MSPPPPAAVARPKKKDKWGEEAESTASRSHADMSSSSRQHSQPHSKHSRSSSSDSSVSPPRSKDNKAKAKAKAKKKKSRAGKESDSDESHIKSKKWLSPLKKTLKLKKAKAMGGSGDAKVVEEERPPKQRSASPKASRRGDRPELMGEEPMLPSRSHESRRESDTARSRGHSSEKREKKVKGGRQSSESPAPLLDRSRGAKRGDSSRDTSFGRKGRQSESPVQQGDRSGSSRRGDNSRDLPYDRRKLDQRDRGESRKGVGDERSKRPATPPLRQAEISRRPPEGARESVGETPCCGKRRGAAGRTERGGAAGRSLSPVPPPPLRIGAGDRRGSVGVAMATASISTGVRIVGSLTPIGVVATIIGTGDRRPAGTESSRGVGEGETTLRDLSETRRGVRAWVATCPLTGRTACGEEGAETGGTCRGTTRGVSGAEMPPGTGGTTATGTEMDVWRKVASMAARGMGRTASGAAVSGKGGSRSGGEWGADRGDPSRDLGGGRLDERGRVPGGNGSVGSGSSGGRLYRDDGREGGDRRGREVIPEVRPPLEGGRLDRPDRSEIRSERDARLDRGDGRLDRGDGRMERGDSRGEGRLDRVEGRMDRGEGRLERGDSRGDRGLPRNDSRHDRLDRVDNRLDRGDVQMEHRRGEQPVPPMDQRGFRQGRGMGAGPGPGDGRGAMRGVGSRSPVDNRGFEFDRRDPVVGGRPGDRDARMMDRDRELGGLGQLPPPRDRFLPAGPAEFRRDDPAFRDIIPEAGGGGAIRDRRGDDRFIGPEGIDLPPRGDHRFDDVRDDRVPGRGQGEDRQGRDRMMPRRGGHFDFGRGPGPEVRPPDMLPNQRRGPLLPTPVEEPPRRGGRGEAYDREPQRVGRDGPRDAREGRGGRRDQRDGDLGPEMGRGGREPPREGVRDPPAWERDAAKEGRAGRDGPRDLGRRSGGGFNAPGEDFPLDADRSRDADRSDSKRRDRDKEAQDADPSPSSKRGGDKKEGEAGNGGGGKDSVRGEKTDASDARSTRSADDVRELAGPRGKDGEPAVAAAVGGAGGSGAALLKGVRDRDSRSDGKRSPDPNQGKPDPSLPGRRAPVRARSLSPKQRSRTPGGAAGGGGGGADTTRSPGRRRSPSRRGAPDQVPSPASKTGGRRGRSRTPVGTKRKLEEDLRSPRGGGTKDDTKSPVAKRPREESRSPGRKGSSRHPSPAGSHHSLGSHSSVERRRLRPGGGGLTQREPETRFFGSSSAHNDRDSPARRDRERERDSPAWRERERERERERDSPARRDRDRERDKEGKAEKVGEAGKGDGDKAEGSRKRGRSPPRPHGRGSDSGDRGRKRWRGDGSWSEAEGVDSADKEGHKQRTGGGGDQPKAPEEAGDTGDSIKTPSSGMAPLGEAAKASRSGRGPEGEDSSHKHKGEGGEAASLGDGADDSKDASLKNVLYEDDYEKISSDESDFEADDGEKQAQNIVSVLDIDWASLAKQPAPKQTTGSLLKRFHPANVFRQIGVSRALAGDSLFEKIEAICKEGVPAEDGKENGKDKENVDQSAEATTQAKGGAKRMDTSLQSDVPVLHMAAVRQKRERTNLLRNLGPFRRALCARRDLEIRRQLCKVDKVYEQPAVFPTHVMDTDLCKLSMQLFRQGRDFVERKDSECDGKIELAI
ncbi:uncharacterized protein LOC143275497 [Babylonia areolata]|uniref:uncharacterized protein LOC143275497 n=1 Tax=Babylonia areolata TaxID=304850 RepID=UPI003FD4BF5D